MTSINLHIGINGNGYKVGFHTGNEGMLAKVVESVPSLRDFYNLGEYLARRGVSDVNLIAAFQNIGMVRDTLANKLVLEEDPSNAGIFIGSLKMVEEQIDLFGRNHGLTGIPNEELARLYASLKDGLASREGLAS